MAEHGKTILRQSSMSMVGRVLGMGFNFLSTFIFAQVLGAERLGLFVLARTVSFLVSLVGSLGYGPTTLRFVSRFNALGLNQARKSIVSYAILSVLIASLVLAILLFILKEPLASWVFDDESLSFYLGLFAVTIPLQAFLHVSYGIFRGMKNVAKKVMIESLILPAIQLAVLSIAGVIMELDLLAVVLCVITSYSVATAVSFLILRRLDALPAQLSFSLRPILKKHLRSYQFPLLLSSSVDFLQRWIDTLILGILVLPAEVGVFAVALRISTLISFPLLATNSIFGPLMSELHAKKDLVGIKLQYQRISRVVFSCSAFIFGLFYLFGWDILNLFGEEYVDGFLALLILCIGQLINVSVGSSGQLLVMTGSQRLNLYNSLLFVAVSVGLNFWLIPQMGLLGAAIANASSLSLLNVLRVIQIYLSLGIQPLTPRFISVVIGNASVILGLYWLNQNFDSLMAVRLLLYLTLSIPLVFIAFSRYERSMFLTEIMSKINKRK